MLEDRRLLSDMGDQQAIGQFGAPLSVSYVSHSETLAGTFGKATVTDKDPNTLLVEIDVDLVDESVGGSVGTGTVTRDGPPDVELEVVLTTDPARQVYVPSTLVIPAGEISTLFDIEALNDGDVDGTQLVTVTATAAGYTEGTDSLNVTDDDIADLRTVSGRVFGTLPAETYQVIGNLVVHEGTTWTLEAGTSLQFNADKELSVDGRLLAEAVRGTEIVFTSAADAPAPGDWNGIQATSSSGPRTVLEHVVIEYATTGLYVWANEPQLTISNADVRFNSIEGISLHTGTHESISSDDVLILDSQVYDNSTGIAITATASSNYNGRGSRNNPTIAGNVAFNNGIGISTSTSLFRGYGYVKYTRVGAYPTVIGNVIRDNGQAIEGEAREYASAYGSSTVGGTYLNNLVKGNDGDGLRLTCVGPGLLTPYVVNNTIVNNQAAGIATLPLVEPAIIRNNLIAGNTRGIEALDAYIPVPEAVGYNLLSNHDGNDFVGYPPEYGDWNTVNCNGTPADFEMNVFGDPAFIAQDDFHLLSTSPAINAGIDVGWPLYEPLTDDFDGQPRTSPPDIGCYEYPVAVIGRRVFYNNSSFDGNDPTANAQDDAAIAMDKRALLPGQTATFDNYTSFSRGINGIMVDVANPPDGAIPTTADFRFKVGNTNNPAEWTDAPEPMDITVRPSAGAEGSDRIMLTWPDNAIQSQWLQVTVLATANTGLPGPDVFYFGNAIGECGNSTTDAKVNAFDMLGARDNQRNLLNPAPIDFFFDYNRDALVNATDMLIARNNQTHFLNALELINVPQCVKTQDTVLQKAAAQHTLAKLTWLYELDPNTQSPKTAQHATDNLMTTCLP